MATLHISVDGRPAVIKAGTAFDYVLENSLFSGRDAFTLSITFPLADCHENTEIFGHISRKDVAKHRASFDCRISVGKIYLAGMLTVVSVSDKEVGCQFTEDRCSRTLATDLDNVFITDLDLGEQPVERANAVGANYEITGIGDMTKEVPLPWINEDYPDVPNNWVEMDEYGHLQWRWTAGYVSWQPYLVWIAENICKKVGFTPDFKAWRNSKFRYLLICNTLPPTWDMPGYARALPRWSVTEFFDKLELLLGCRFRFDLIEKSVTMEFEDELIDPDAPVLIDTVVDTYTVDIADEEEQSCDYVGSKPVKYADIEQEIGKFYVCDKFVAENAAKAWPYANLQALIDTNNLRPDSATGVYYWGEKYVEGGNRPGEEGKTRCTVNRLFRTLDDGRFYLLHSIGYRTVEGQGNVQCYVIQPVNPFGCGVADDDTDTQELDFVPVPIDYTHTSPEDDMGPMMFLKPGQLDGEDDEAPDYSEAAGATSPNDKTGTYATLAERNLMKFDGEKDTGEFYNKIYVGYWDGTIYDPDGYVYPILDNLLVSQSWQKFTTPYTLRLQGQGVRAPFSSLPKINPAVKYKFSWLSDSIPDVRSVFHIAGRRYLCEKITATFTESGMSQLLKGEFYPLSED